MKKSVNALPKYFRALSSIVADNGSCLFVPRLAVAFLCTLLASKCTEMGCKPFRYGSKTGGQNFEEKRKLKRDQAGERKARLKRLL